MRDPDNPAPHVAMSTRHINGDGNRHDQGKEHAEVKQSSAKGGSENAFEISEQQLVFETPIVSIRSGPVTCRRSGKKKNFYLFDFPDWVNVVAVTPERQVVLIRQYRYGSAKDEIEIPGGMIDPGENPVEAGERELLEETGFSGENARVIGRVCPNPAIQANGCYTVLVENVVRIQNPRQDDMEDIETFTEPLSLVLGRIADGSIDHGLVLNGLMFYRMHVEGNGDSGRGNPL